MVLKTCFFDFPSVCFQLRRLGFRHWIVNNSDSKLSEFWQQLYPNLDSNIKIVSSISNLMYFQSLLDLTKIYRIWSLLDLKVAKKIEKLNLMSIKRLMKSNLIKKSINLDFFDQIRSLSIYFPSISNISIKSGYDLIHFVTTIW